MSHEFDESEMFPCDLCGDGFPREEMYELPDGTIVCPGCMNRVVSELNESEIYVIH